MREIQETRVINCNLRINNLVDSVSKIILQYWGQVFKNLVVLFTLSNEKYLSQKAKKSIAQQDKNFENFLIEIENKVEPSNFRRRFFLDFIRRNKNEWLEQLVKMRNALEHPDKKKKLIIENFKVSLNRSIEAPSLQLIQKSFSGEKEHLIEFVNLNSSNLHFFSIHSIFLCIAINLKKVHCGTNKGDIYEVNEEFFEKQFEIFSKNQPQTG